MNKIILILTCIFLSAMPAIAQKPCEKLQFTPFNKTTESPSNTAGKINLQEVDATDLLHKLEADRIDHPKVRYQVIVSSSTSCGGTPGAVSYMNKIKATYGDSVLVYYIIGDHHDNCAKFISVLDDLAPNITVYATNSTYVKKDAREGSDDLTKELFPETKEDVILTPKFLIIDTRTGKLVFHGGRYYKNPLPGNIVEYFMSQPASTGR